jgi:hypothetical protein
MANRNLTSAELVLANELLAKIRNQLETLAGEDSSLLFAYRRKIAKELTYDERGKPADRKKVKILKWALQNRKCAHCGEELPLKNSELDRRSAEEGYTVENTDLVHAHCHDARQAANNYH